MHNLEEAKEKSNWIQQAFDILSDPMNELGMIDPGIQYYEEVNLFISYS